MNIRQLRPSSPHPISVADLITKVRKRAGLEATVARGSDQTPVTSVSLDSHDVVAGEAFVALPGARRHGAQFTPSAFESGAVAVITDEDGLAQLIADPRFFTDHPLAVVVLTEDVRRYAGYAAAAVWDYPHEQLRTVGITGTNGKTTTSHFLAHALEELAGTTLLIGTAGITLGQVHVESERTSVEAPVLHRLLAWAVENGARSVVMEVSSHALVLHRVAGMHFDAVAFLNLQRDHLDFHSTMEEYFAAKASLFAANRAQRAVVCIDDQWGEKLLQQIRGSGQLPTMAVATRPALGDGENPQADLSVADIKIDAASGGTDFTVHYQARSVALHCPLPGVINVQNQVIALGILIGLGFSASDCAQLLGKCPPVPGRMEVVTKRSDADPLVIVDFAHTSDALTLACAALDPVTPGRLWCLFGATGERDGGKRPLMGQAAAQAADVVIITDDDVYGEDPAQIRAQVAAGIEQVGGDQPAPEWRVEVLWEDDDRAHAIELAVVGAGAQDTVLIAGRGHETIQTVGERAIELDDRDCARQALQLRHLQGEQPQLLERAKAHLHAGRVRLQSAPKTWEDRVSPKSLDQTESMRKHP